MESDSKNDRASVILNNLIKSKGIRKTKIADDLEINYQSLMNKFNRNSFTFDEARKIASICGYEIIFRDKDSGEDL